MKQQKKILIKGKHLGLSDLILWGKGNQRRQIQINIIDKRSHQKIFQLTAKLQALGLKVEIIDKTLLLQGEIKNYEHYLSLSQLNGEAKDQKLSLNWNDVYLKPSLQRVIFSKFLQEIMRLNLMRLL